MNTLFEKRERNEPRVWNRAVESLEKKKDFVSLENIALKVSKFRHTHTHMQDLDLSRPIRNFYLEENRSFLSNNKPCNSLSLGPGVRTGPDYTIEEIN